MNFKKLAVGAAVALSLTAGASQAQVALFQDDDIDFVWRGGAGGGTITAGNLAVGDVLVSVFEIPTFTLGGVSQIPAGSELTGVAAIEIASIVTVPATDVSIITFTETALGLDFFLAMGGDPDATVPGGGAGGGATIAMWMNAAGAGDDRNLRLDFADLPATNCTSFADCIDQASRGSLVQVDGFGGDADDAWVAQTTFGAGGADIDNVAGTAGSVLVASFNARQTNFFNSFGDVVYMNVVTGAPCPAGTPAADGCIRGGTLSGTITGGAGLSNGAFARSDLDAQKLIPEPGTLAILGAALLGFAGLRRRS
jgi:hypothetical protein